MYSVGVESVDIEKRYSKERNRVKAERTSTECMSLGLNAMLSFKKEGYIFSHLSSLETKFCSDIKSS